MSRRAPKREALQKWLLLPDTHVPFHDRRAFRLALEVGVKIGCKNIATLGDFADFYAISSHPKPPDRRSSIQWEIDEVNTALNTIDSMFPGKKKFVGGNHCYRLDRYLSDKAPELHGTLTVPGQFRLKERGWEWIPYKSFTKIGKMHLTHDLGKAGRYAHYDALAGFQSNVVIGHVHRLAYAVEGTAKGEPHVTASLGWLGDRDQCEYMFKVRAARDWALGFGILYKEPNGNVHLTPVPIVDYKVVVEGKLFKG